jgi:hypothetical protein
LRWRSIASGGRRRIRRHTSPESELPLVPGQEELAHRLDSVDFWGKALTAASVAYGLVLVTVFLYQAWNQGLS